MPPVEEIDEFDDDVSHLVRPDIEWTRVDAHFLLQAATNSVIAATAANSVVAAADSLVLEFLFIFQENEGARVWRQASPVWGARRPPSGARRTSKAPGAPLGHQADGLQVHFWGARRPPSGAKRPSGPHLKKNN
ncbi:hypothetical protein TIFTF001_025152 [Ficus carica]|uniref:Uncharacterized protein n=1 Tax=Ficus carica TaxID=3494 RepID=A0AA88AYJ6_FICCA|nr:hypothetical protein TIFTF001_025152 [Ficus carica]